MTDTQKIKAIEKIIASAFEFEPTENERKDGYYEAVAVAISAIIDIDQGGEDNA